MFKSTRKAAFNLDMLPSTVVEPNAKYIINEQCLVLNPTPETMELNNHHNLSIAPFSSMIIVNDEITPSALALVIRLPKSFTEFNFEQFEGWKEYKGYFSDIEKSTDLANAKETVFLRSPQDTLGVYTFTPSALANEVSGSGQKKQFVIKANLWAAKKSTHCGLHNQHDFVEIHTQVLGFGRMQKFKDNNYSSLCEQIMMAPGYTTSESFCNFNSNNCQFNYPHHQFYADTDSVWLALEYYPICSEENTHA